MFTILNYPQSFTLNNEENIVTMETAKEYRTGTRKGNWFLIQYNLVQYFVIFMLKIRKVAIG